MDVSMSQPKMEELPITSSWRCWRKESLWDLKRSLESPEPSLAAPALPLLLLWWSWWLLEDWSKNWERGRNECEERDLNPRKGLDGVGEEDNGCGVPDFCGDSRFNDSGLLFFRGEEDKVVRLVGVGA